MRGKWVLEVVFGTPPAPPPPDAGMINEEQEKGKAPKTFRELLAQHARQPSCAACHAKIDPLGFALENYDAVGRWRETADDRPLDATGELPTGEKFDGRPELKQIVLQRQDQFVRNLVEQMLVYALGRELEDYDDCAVTAIVRRPRRRTTTASRRWCWASWRAFRSSTGGTSTDGRDRRAATGRSNASLPTIRPR